MPKNNYFQFKQFRIEQNHAAMRVGTDGVLLGAWVKKSDYSRILDIGTGTGLLALMLAQRFNAEIDAIDIDINAINDAKQNVSNSPWKNQINVFHSSIQDFSKITKHNYDLIVCNPPFFNNGVKPKDDKRKLARHTDSLSFSDLLNAAATVLKTDGTFNVILPLECEKEFKNFAFKQRLFATRITRIKPNPIKPIKRVLIEFQFEGELISENELTVEREIRHSYTPEFTNLVKDFYLNL